MKTRPRRFKDISTSSDIFRLATLVLYGSLLLHVALTAYTRHLLWSESSPGAIAILAILFVAALTRYFRPKLISPRTIAHLAELLLTIMVVVLLTRQRSTYAMPLPWLIGVAGVFPLAVEGAAAISVVCAIALIGCAINLDLGVNFGELLPQTFATVFVGLLALMLSKALRINVSAVKRARTTNRRFEAITRAARHVFMITNAQFQLKYANPSLKEVIGYTQGEMADQDFRLIFHPDDAEEHQQKLRYLVQTVGGNIFSRHRARHKMGQWVWLETCAYNMLHDPDINGLVFSIEDITARKEVEFKLDQEHALLRAVLDRNPAMIYAKDTDGRFTISNQSFQRHFGYASEDELRGKTSYDLLLRRAGDGSKLDAYEIADTVHRQDLDVIASGVAMEDLAVQGFAEQDARRWYRTNKYALRDARGDITGMLGITRDITDRKEYEMRLEHQALHDPLTGLPNRRYLHTAIADVIVRSQGKHATLVALFCNLDFFKSVNDTHGHDFGDKCLKTLTKRIVAELPTSDFVARFGGNEFVVLTNGSLHEAQAKADSLLHRISQQLEIDGTIVKIQSSIGIVQLTKEHKTPSDLLRDADAAMHQAKEQGRNRVEMFDASAHNTATKRAQMDVALRFALERQEFALVFQPKVSMLDGSIKGFELLLRWNSPEYGDIPPTEFIPIAEISGMVVPIGLWVLEEACRQLSHWQDTYAGISDLVVAVNVSMRQLLQPSFLDEVTRIVTETQILPYSIELEITETSAMANPVQTIETLTMLKRLGLRLALDDFGTGYSSLSYLQKLPLDVLKIDQAFVRGIDKNSSDTEIVRLIIALAKALNLSTVAEGVETQQQITALNKLGCHVGQGYFFSPPVSTQEAEELISGSRHFAVPFTEDTISELASDK